MPGAPSRQLAVLLHADVVGSTALVQLDESLAHQRIQNTFRRLSEIIASHGGTTHEIRGDALVAEISRASDPAEAERFLALADAIEDRAAILIEEVASFDTDFYAALENPEISGPAIDAQTDAHLERTS